MKMGLGIRGGEVANVSGGHESGDERGIAQVEK